MKIHNTSSLPAQWALASAARAAGVDPQKPVAAVRRVDRVRISDEGRAMIDGGADAELSPEQVAEVRRRIQAGVYNSLEAVNDVARRILASRDFDRSL